MSTRVLFSNKKQHDPPPHFRREACSLHAPTSSSTTASPRAPCVFVFEDASYRKNGRRISSLSSLCSSSSRLVSREKKRSARSSRAASLTSLPRLGFVSGAAQLASAPLPTHGHARRERLRELSDGVARTIHDCKYHPNVVKLAAKFDEELKRLLDELRRQAHREWNLAHLCARLDYNSYWTSPGHATLGAAASLSSAAAARAS